MEDNVLCDFCVTFFFTWAGLACLFKTIVKFLLNVNAPSHKKSNE